MTQQESWVDLRVNEAMKRDIDQTLDDENSDVEDKRLTRPKVAVSLMKP